MPNDNPRRVTVVETLVVRKDDAAAFDGWQGRLTDALVEQFGPEVTPVRFDQASGVTHLVYRVSDRAAFDRWLASDRQRALADEAAGFATTGRQITAAPNPRIELPSEASAPTWKRAAVSWLAVFPLLLVTSTASQALVPDWPRPVALALSSLVLTLMLNYVVFPRLNRRLGPWLLADPDGDVTEP